MTRGHRGSLLLRCRAFPSPPSCRFIPALSDDRVSTQRPSRKSPAAMSSSPTAGLSRRPLIEVFEQVPDPRDPRGVRHTLATVLTLAQTAVLAGAQTLLAIAEWTQDADRDMLSRIGIDPNQALPSESTMRGALALLDADDLDARLAGWMATRPAGHPDRLRPAGPAI